MSKSKAIIEKVTNGYIIKSDKGIQVIEGDSKSLESFISRSIIGVVDDKLRQCSTVKVEIEVSNTFQPGEV